MCSFSETFRQRAKQYFQSAFKILQIITNDAVKREEMMKEWRKTITGVMWWAYPPSEVCGRVWWSAWGWACFLEWASEGGRGSDWVPLTGSGNDTVSTTLSAEYSCITAPSWAPSLLQDWQLQWKILSTSLSTCGDSLLPGQSKVTCLTHTHTHTQLVCPT